MKFLCGSAILNLLRWADVVSSVPFVEYRPINGRAAVFANTTPPTTVSISGKATIISAVTAVPGATNISSIGTSGSSTSAANSTDVFLDPICLAQASNFYATYVTTLTTSTRTWYEGFDSAGGESGPVVTQSFYTTTEIYPANGPEAWANGRAEPPCCSTCLLNAATVQFYYWSDQVSPTATPSTDATSTGAVVTIVDSNGFTFTSPSVYIAFTSLGAKNFCGNVGTDVYGTTVAFDSDEISTWPPSTTYWTSYSRSTDPKFGIVSVYITEDATQLPIRALTYSDLGQNCSTIASYKYWSGNPSLFGQNTDPCHPVIAIPTRVQSLQQAWVDNKCTQYKGYGFYDPPGVLTPAASIDKATLPPAPGPTTTAPGPSPTVVKALPITTEGPILYSPHFLTEQTGIASASVPKEKPTDESKPVAPERTITIVSKVISSLVGGSQTDIPGDAPPVTPYLDTIEITTTGGILPSPIVLHPGDSIDTAKGYEAPPAPKASDLGWDIATAIGYEISTSLALGRTTYTIGVQPEFAGQDQTRGIYFEPGPTMTGTSPVQDFQTVTSITTQENGQVGTTTGIVPAASQSNGPPVLIIEGSTYSANSASQYVLPDGQTVSPDGTTVVIGGTPVALMPGASTAVIAGSTVGVAQPAVTVANELLGTSTIALTLADAAPSITVVGQTITANAAGAYVISGSALSVGGPAVTVDSEVYNLQTNSAGQTELVASRAGGTGTTSQKSSTSSKSGVGSLTGSRGTLGAVSTTAAVATATSNGIAGGGVMFDGTLVATVGLLFFGFFM